MKDFHVDVTQRLILGKCTVRCLSNVNYYVSSTYQHSTHHQLLFDGIRRIAMLFKVTFFTFVS